MRLDELLAKLRERGLRITPQRREILRLLVEDGGHLTAQDVHERLRPLFPDVSLDTVYRTLRTLAGFGILCQSHLQTRHASRFSLSTGRHHHHHLVCLDCGETIALTDCPVTDALNEIAVRHAFQPTGHAFEIYGYCGACAQGRGGR